MQFLICGTEHNFTITRLSEWAAQCVYRDLVCFSRILEKPDIFPIVDTPSQPWPCNSYKYKPRFSKHLTRASTVPIALTLFNFKRKL